MNTTADPAEYFLDPSEAVTAFAISVGAETHTLHRFWRAPRKNQQSRYEQILLGTIRLARVGGYDAVQVRDVATESGVSLASIYTYFGSRDNLAYRAAVIWCSLMMSRAKLSVARAVAGIDDPLERTLARFETQATTMLSEPQMLALWVRSTMTDDPDVVAAQRGIHWAYWIDSNPMETNTADEQQELQELVQDVFYAGAVRWVFGQQDLEEVLTSVREIGPRLKLLLPRMPETE